MRASTRSSTVSRLAGAAAALWLCGAGAASAGGGGGADLQSIQAIIGPADGSKGFCFMLGIGPKSGPPLGPTANNSCPQLPTITQAILEAAGLGNNLPEMVAAQTQNGAGERFYAGNPAAGPPTFPNFLPPLPLTSTTPPTVSDVLATLTPLAFVSQSLPGTAQATQLYASNADTFLYAVGVSSSGSAKNGLTDPDMLYFFYEDLFQKNQKFPTGQTVAKFSFPLTVLSKDSMGNFSELAVPITLTFIATSAGDCSMSTVTGNFPGVTGPLLASQIGINCAVVFSASLTSAQPHPIFEVAVPLLVTGRCFNAPGAGCPSTPPSPDTDPAYFYTARESTASTNVPNPVNTAVFTAFFSSDHTNGSLDIGLAPTAGPLGPRPAPGVLSPFALCASLPATTNGPVQLRAAVGAYYAMATSGEMLLSAPLPPPSPASSSFCPLL